MHVAEKQCSQARGAVQQVEQARLVSTELQAQLLRADQALHSQRQFVMSLQAAAQEAAQGGCPALDYVQCCLHTCLQFLTPSDSS